MIKNKKIIKYLLLLAISINLFSFLFATTGSGWVTTKGKLTSYYNSTLEQWIICCVCPQEKDSDCTCTVYAPNIEH